MQLISREQLDHTLQFPSTGRHCSGLCRTNCPQVRSRSRVRENQARQERESATKTSSRLSLPSANCLDVRFTLRCITEHTSQWYLVVLVSSPRGGSHMLLLTYMLTTWPSGPTLHRKVRNGHLCVISFSHVSLHTHHGSSFCQLKGALLIMPIPAGRLRLCKINCADMLVHVKM